MHTKGVLNLVLFPLLLLVTTWENSASLNDRTMSSLIIMSLCTLAQFITTHKEGAQLLLATVPDRIGRIGIFSCGFKDPNNVRIFGDPPTHLKIQ